MRKVILSRLAGAGFASGMVALSVLAGCSSDDSSDGSGGRPASSGGTSATTGGTAGGTAGTTTGGTVGSTGGTSTGGTAGSTGGAAGSTGGAGAGGTAGTTTGGTAGSGTGGAAGSGTGGTAGSGGTGTAPNCTASFGCVMTAFSAGCTSCHLAGGPLSAGVDLQSAGVEGRLKNVKASHTGAMPSTSCGQNDLLIDTANPDNSWLLKKLKGTQGQCGLPMPYGAVADPATVTCVSNWINCLAGKGG